jgi:hypothetical protein
MDEIKVDADKYKIALDKYYETVSEKFQSAAAAVVATLLHSKGPILGRIIMAIKGNRNSGTLDNNWKAKPAVLAIKADLSRTVSWSQC